MDRLAAFQRTMALCFQGHPYYRELFGRLGLTPSDFKTPSDLARLPVTDKATWLARPDDFRLRLDGVEGVSIEERTLWELVYTTGTTTRPTPFYDTSHDHYSRLAQMKRMAEMSGVVPDDVVANLFPLTAIPHQGYLSAYYGTLGAGAKMVAALSGRGYPEFLSGRDTDEIIRFLEKHRPTVLWGIATFVRRLLMRAQELGADFSNVRMIFAMGECCSKGFRGDLKERMKSLGAGEVAVWNGYGFTEMQGPTYECREGGGCHLAMPELYHLEILDSETLQPAPMGQPGLVIVSHLHRRGTVLLRYRVGDLSALRDDPCPDCGRTGLRFVMPPTRIGGIVKVKGTLMDPRHLDEILTGLAGVDDYQCVVSRVDADDPFSMDKFVLRIAAAAESRGKLAQVIPETIRRAIEITPQIEFVTRDQLLGDDAQYKFKRFVDARTRNGPVAENGLTDPAMAKEEKALP